MYEGFTCTAKWAKDATEPERYYIENYLGGNSWTDGDRTQAPSSHLQEITKSIGDYLTPTQAYSSETTNEVFEATTRKNRGKEKLLSWTGVQHCAASTLWWTDVGTREE